MEIKLVNGLDSPESHSNLTVNLHLKFHWKISINYNILIYLNLIQNASKISCQILKTYSTQRKNEKYYINVGLKMNFVLQL